MVKDIISIYRRENMDFMYIIQIAGMLGIIISLFIVALQKPSQGQVIMLFLMLCIGIIMLGNWFHMTVQTPEVQIIAQKLMYLGDCWVYFLVLLYFSYYFQFNIPKSLCFFLFFISFAFVIISFTSDKHPYFYKSCEYIMVEGVLIAVKEYNILHSVYKFIVFSYGIILPFIAFIQIIKNKKKQRKAPILLFCAVLFPTCLQIVGWTKIYIPPFLPQAVIAPTGVVLLYILCSSNVLNIQDIARNTVFSFLNDGLVITDDNFCLKEINQIASDIFPEFSKRKKENCFIEEVSKQLFQILIGEEYSFIEHDERVYRPSVHTIMEKSTVSGYLVWLSDVTDNINNCREKHLNEKRLQIIYNEIDDIIFEWDLCNNKVQYSSKFEKKYGYIPKEEFWDINCKNTSIYFEDFPLIQQVKENFLNGETFVTIEHRMKKISAEKQEYVWCRNRIAVVKDENEIPYMAIGLITDINEEKKEFVELEKMAKQDVFTKLLNKQNACMQMKEYLQQVDGILEAALFIIDIDNFKSVNEKIGHLGADIVIQEVAHRIQITFEKDDIVGRFGGDEYIVLMKHIPSKEAVYNKAIQLTALLKELYFVYGKQVFVSCSIGFAVYKKHGENFDELFKHADEALYFSKRKGKGCYTIYKDL